MKNSSSLDELLEKSSRYAAAWHTQNYLVVAERGPRRVVIEHKRRDGAAPHPLESALRCGISVVFLEHIGCRELTVHWGADPTPIYANGEYREPPLDQPHRWIFEWSALVPRPVIAGLDEYLLRDASPAPLAEALQPRQRLAFLLRREPAGKWTVKRAAKALTMSTRSLQRALSAEGTTFSQELLRARIDEARRLLTETDLSCAEVGLLTGFSDAAHFTTRFRRETGVTPGQYRAREQ